MARIWDVFLTERDKRVFEAAGYGREAELKGRPALLIIDVNFGFVGDRPEEILDSIVKFPNSCGEASVSRPPAVKVPTKITFRLF